MEGSTVLANRATEKKPTRPVANPAVQTARRDWMEKFDGPVAVKNVVLGSPTVRHMHKRTFEHVGRNVHFISVFGRILAGEASIAPAEEEIYKRIDEVRTALERKISATEATLVDAKVNTTETSFNKKETIESKIIVPAQKKYLDILDLADRLMLLVNTLWLEGEISDKSKSKAEHDLKNLIRQIPSTTRKLRVYLQGKIVEESNKANASPEAKKAMAQLQASGETQVPNDGLEEEETATAGKAEAAVA